ncbi:30S ribosomal protein S4 [Candidatus Shapirobacteria bacterium]|nr:30S ribosomal protein S4 [Candidatus Shapirobacteria bacterium]
MALLNQKCRLCRREKTKLFLKGERCFSAKCPLERKGPVAPGEHGLKSSLRLSGYGTQLRGKQRVKRFYGVSEKQLKNYFLKAEKIGGEMEKNLICLLESRLDNVVYKMGLTPSRRTARQLIVHGHFKVNDQKVTIPSFQTKEKDRIELSAKAGGLKQVKEWLAKKDVEIPDWLAKKGLIGLVKGAPKVADLPADFDSGLVVEYYSR